MQHSKSLITLALAAVISQPASANALDAIPQESGWSGFVGFGVGSTSLKSNTIAGSSLGGFDNERIDSLGSPKSETSTSPYFSGELAYTWAEQRTQVYLGNQLQNYLRYDFTQELGVRREFSEVGTLSASYLFSALPTEVWKDPYLDNNSKRKTTDRTSSGIQLGWGRIMGSNFSLVAKQRKVEIDEEQSGASQGLSLADQKLLERDGTITSVELNYRLMLNKNHSILPSVTYTRYDLDGKAMANDEVLVHLSHLYINKQWRIVTNLAYGQGHYDKSNPIFAETRDDKIYGASLTAFYTEPFGWKNWSMMGSLAAYRSSSNISFYDTNISGAKVGLVYRF